MAADAYLRVAAAQLQEAASAVKQQIGQLRSETTQFNQQASHQITSKQSEHMAKQNEVAMRKNEPGVAATLQMDVQNIQKEIETNKQAIAARTAETDQKIRAKEDLMQNLMSQSQALAQQASDPNLQ